MDVNIKIPNHLGIIVDGNGRWASNRGLSRSEGHKAGAKRLKEIIKYTFSKGVRVLSIYVFSTENFKRSDEEVNYLMELFVHHFKSEFSKLKDENVKIVFSGRREPLPDKVLKIMDKLTEDTKNNDENILNICMNYGGHAEIIDATKKISNEVLNMLISIDSINEETFSKYLYNELPPLDFVIRTSGEVRLSNFMLWQLSYSELYFPEIYFPDFDKKAFDEALIEYNNRNRRFGGIKYENKNH
ncbi:MAG: polyprenyl diphosphate synthase [Bacilli bacterium]|nr:polyprenyl diphosphate synthase [Bacilli bacterium]MDD4282600.1 polyprenyl diphosphate synthase [Bacilli bacterium]MDD4719227.1 polyprenyl diphosphate synthase [Bacilli bacterium]